MSLQARSVPPHIAAAIDAALAARDFALASQLARAALDAGHVHPLLLHLRAVSNKRKGLYEAALADIERARLLMPRSIELMIEAADCLNALGQYEYAAKLAGEAIIDDPRRASAWQQKARALQSLADLDGARNAFLEVTRLDSSNAFAHASLAEIAAGQNRLAEARRHAAQALQIEPESAAALVVIATLDRAEGRLDDARACLETVLGLDGTQAPLRVMAKIELGEVLHAEGRTAEAFETYRGAKTMWKSFYGPHVLKPGVEPIPAMLARLASGLHVLPPGPW